MTEDECNKIEKRSVLNIILPDPGRNEKQEDKIVFGYLSNGLLSDPALL